MARRGGSRRRRRARGDGSGGGGNASAQFASSFGAARFEFCQRLREPGKAVPGERRSDVDTARDLGGAADHAGEAADHHVVDVVPFERGERARIELWLGSGRHSPNRVEHAVDAPLGRQRYVRRTRAIRGRAGHAPTMTLDTYAHLFDEYEGAETRSAEDLIRAARDHFMCPQVSVLCPRGDDADGRIAENPCYFSEPTPGLEPGTPSLRVKCSTS